jgi:hypothetical protein
MQVKSNIIEHFQKEFYFDENLNTISQKMEKRR